MLRQLIVLVKRLLICLGFAREGTQRDWIINGLVTLQQAYSGIGIWGETGAGKTSSIGEEILFLAFSHPSRMGVFIPCAVPAQFKLVMKVAELTGRVYDVERWAPGSGIYDWLNYELKSPFGSVETASQLLDQLVQLSDRALGTGSGENPYWPLLQQKLTRRAIAAIWYGTGRCSCMDLYRFFTSAPLSPQQAADPNWQKTAFCFQVLKQGDDEGKGAIHDFEVAAMFWMLEFPAMEAKSRSIGLSMCTNILDKFIMGMAAGMTSGESTQTPDLCLDGKIWCVDTPPLQFGQPGQFLLTIAKLGVQRACQRRNMAENPRPVLFFVDEPQHTLLPDIDHMFQTTARQSGAISVFLTQNMPTLYAALGGGEKAKQQVDGWIGNHVTKVFTANSDAATNTYAADLIGKSRQLLMNGHNNQEYDLMDDVMGRNNAHIGWSESWYDECPGPTFTRLLKGGAHKRVEAIVYQGGRRFANGKTWVRTEFRQR